MQSANGSSGASKPNLTRQLGQRNLFNPRKLPFLSAPGRRNIYAGNQGGEFSPNKVPQNYIDAQGLPIRRSSGGYRTRNRKTNRNLKKSKKSRTRKTRR
jgi:hypothetical protein